MTGYDTAVLLLRANDIRGISIGRISGTLSDHYNPTKKIVNLSEGVFGSDSIAAVAVAAHEIGHVVQKEKGYLFYKIRTALVPVVNIGSKLAMPLVLIGIIIDYLSLSAGETATGFNLAMIGVILYASSLAFTLVTLPVELNASKRAKQMLLAQGILADDEIKGANAVLSAAAFTYLASLLTSAVYFFRFLLYVLAIFGKRNNRR
jgi:Zn-dependent membrane protease YugP